MAEFSWRHIWLVMRREYRVRVRSRSFIISTVATPLMFAGFVLLAAYFANVGIAASAQTDRVRAVIVCADPQLADSIEAQLSARPTEDYTILVNRDASAATQARLDSQLRQSAIAAYVWLDRGAIADGRADYYGRDPSDYYLFTYLRNKIALALARTRLAEGGMARVEIDHALSGPHMHLQFSGSESSQPKSLFDAAGPYIVTYGIAYLLVFAIISYGNMLMQSVMEEKLSRITELLLVSTKPEELMAGKILGVGCVGLTQMAIWCGLATAPILMVPEGRALIRSLNLHSSLAVYFLIFFLLGYLLYSALSAIVGTCSGGGGPSRAQSQWMVLELLPLMLAMMLIPTVSSAPNSTIAVVSSMIPYLAPVLMCARAAAGSVPIWQIAICLLTMIATIAISSVAAARIYRVGILMYGKRLTLREVVRWVRYP